MKKLSLTSLLLVIALGLTSCSNETDSLLLDNPNAEAFDQKPTVQRSADGSYYLGYKTNNGIGSDVTINSATNTKNVNLFSDENEKARSFTEDLSLDGKESFTLGINNTIKNTKSTITVFDEDIKFSRGAKTDHLNEYKITDNLDGSYTVDFLVKNNIKVDFIKNEDNNRYEIHLDKGKPSQSDFSRTFTKVPDEDLEIVFINYHHDVIGRSLEANISRKPKIIIGNGENE